MPFAKSDAATIHYTVRGQGKTTILLLMGLGGHASEWGDPFLDRLTAKHRVVCMDNRGIGQSESRVESWSLSDMAGDACIVLDAMGVPSAHVAGTSMGGMIAQTLALEHPERVQKLVLMSTSFGGREAEPPTPEAAAVLLPVPGAPVADLQRRTLELLTAPEFARANAELIEQLSLERQRMPTRGRIFKAQMSAIMGSDRAQRVRGLRHPTLVVHGQDDLLIPVDNGKQLAARIPHARLVLFEGCGHFPHIEKPAECAAAMLEFLDDGR
jgi:3-oxoadipate enol-lactonase